VKLTTPSSAEVKNGGAVSPLLHTSWWRGAELIKHRDNVTFLLIGLLQPPWRMQRIWQARNWIASHLAPPFFDLVQERSC
jgi:hypothetical protein